MKISVAMNFGNRRFFNSGLSGGLVGHKFSPKLSGDRGVEEERRGERREEREREEKREEPGHPVPPEQTAVSRSPAQLSL